MTGFDVPKGVRRAALLTLAMVPIGLLLVLDGLLELRWFASAQEQRLTQLMAQIQSTYGFSPPALLRGHLGAVQLIVLGVAGIAFGLLGLWLPRGYPWAKTWALVLGTITAVCGIFFVGADAAESSTVGLYLTGLRDSAIPQFIPQVQAQLYPGWYPWVEDLIQGAGVLVTVAALIALLAAVIAHGDFFVGRAIDDTEPDEWDDAMARIRQRTTPDPE